MIFFFFFHGKMYFSNHSSLWCEWPSFVGIKLNPSQCCGEHVIFTGDRNFIASQQWNQFFAICPFHKFLGCCHGLEIFLEFRRMISFFARERSSEKKFETKFNKIKWNVVTNKNFRVRNFLMTKDEERTKRSRTDKFEFQRDRSSVADRNPRIRKWIPNSSTSGV